MQQESHVVKKYLSLVKFSHTIFALPFAVIGFFLAIEFNRIDFNWYVFVLMLLCMVFARTAAMAFNRLIDKRIDEKNPRTAGREIPSGAINSRQAFWFVVLNCILFITTTFFINNLVFFLSPVALVVVLGYSYTKRFTALCHFVLGIGLSLAPIGAYLTVTGYFDLLPLIYSFVVLFWVSGFDIIYALQDEDFDKSLKLKSVPVVLGKRNSLLLSAGIHVLSVAGVILAGCLAKFGLWYWFGAAVFSLLLLYQHLIVKPQDLSRVNMAFFTLNGIASVVFAVFFLLELYLP